MSFWNLSKLILKMIIISEQLKYQKYFFTFRGLYQTEPSGGGEMARLLTNGAPLAEDQQPISHRNNCENRKQWKWKEVDVADMVAPLAEQQRHSKVIKAIKTSTCSQKIQGVHEGGYGKQKKWLECEMAVVGGLMEAGPLLVTTPPPSSKALPICQYSCFLTFHPFHILICLYRL